MGADERGVTRRYGRRLQQVGAGLFLLGLLVGLAVPRFALPRLALSRHLLGRMQGLFLLVAGGLWPRLRLSAALSRVGHVAAVVGCVAAWVANLAGALWGAGSTMVPLAAGGVRGTALQEGVIKLLLLSAAPCLIATAGLLLWGLRGSPESE